jgi:hypothetical protein
VGFDKVGVAELLRRELGYSLSEAKAKTGAAMDGDQICARIRG